MVPPPLHIVADSLPSDNQDPFFAEMGLRFTPPSPWFVNSLFLVVAVCVYLLVNACCERCHCGALSAAPPERWERSSS